jgi:H+-transporting ATPase
LQLDIEALRTLAAVTLVFSGQAVLYVAREREHLWRSRPSNWLLASSVGDVTIIASLAMSGIVMTALPMQVVVGVLAAAVLFAFVLDMVKVTIFAHLRVV